jgi:hypothetical protein
VHPSWRDLVIDELAADPEARRRFLAAAGLDGILLGLSTDGGPHGERLMPLLVADGDWDALADRVHALAPELDARAHARLLDALARAIAATDGAVPGRRREAAALAEQALARATTLWERSAEPLDVDLLASWYGLAARVDEAPPAPALDHTWAALLPAGAELDAPSELERLDAWLALCELLGAHDRPRLEALGFCDRPNPLLEGLGEALCRPERCEPAARSALARLGRLVPDVVAPADAYRAGLELATLEADLGPPPRPDAAFDVDRILRDLA